MSRQGIGIVFSLALFLCSAEAPGQQTARPKNAIPASGQAAQTAKAGGNARPDLPLPAMTPEMNQLLLAWEKRSRQVTSLEAKFVRHDTLKSIGEENTFKGVAVLKAPNLAYLDFLEVHKNGQVDPITERIVCDGEKVIQYVADTKQILVWPLAKDARNRAMEEGPLPFLFNMNAAEVKKRYAMALLPTVSNRPNHYLIEITPILAVDRDAFLKAQVFLDKKTFLPSDIKLFLPNEQDYQRYEFRDQIVANPAINPKVFDFVRYKGWQVIQNPGGDSKPRGPVPRNGPQPKQAQANPAARGSAPR